MLDTAQHRIKNIEHVNFPSDVQSNVYRMWPAVVSAVLGIVVVLGVGFAPGIAHEAAHDTRHTLVFPCH